MGIDLQLQVDSLVETRKKKSLNKSYEICNLTRLTWTFSARKYVDVDELYVQFMFPQQWNVCDRFLSTRNVEKKEK